MIVKPVLKDYLSVKQTVEYLNIHGLLNYTADDLYELTVEKKITPVFLVHDKEVIYSNIDKSMCWLTLTGYCECPLSILKFLCDSNESALLEEFTIHSVIKQKNNPIKVADTDIFSDKEKEDIITISQLHTTLNKGNVVKLKRIYKTDFDDSSGEVKEIETSDYVDYIHIKISDIKFSIYELESLLKDSATQTEESLPLQAEVPLLSENRERTYLVIIGALHQLLNQKKGDKSAPFKTKDSLVADIVEANKGIHGISKTNIDDYLKKADNVFEDVKKNID